jgi:hypothetical protein
LAINMLPCMMRFVLSRVLLKYYPSFENSML